ncbi:MAG: hypothetical protein ACKPKO_17385, partial [Candidatus Fonsibacter sp.]
EGPPMNQSTKESNTRMWAKSADNVRAAPSQLNQEAEAQPKQGTRRVLPQTWSKHSGIWGPYLRIDGATKI